MPEPRIAVTIPVGPLSHHREYLPEAVESVRRQTYAASDLFLVDDMAGLGEEAFDSYRIEGDRVGSNYPWPISNGLSADLTRPVDPENPRNQKFRMVAHLWHSPWRLGVPASFNAGVSLARGDYIVMLGADDTLEPDALEQLAIRIEQLGEARAKRSYLWFGIRYMDTGEEQYLPVNAAAVSKELWRATGGFPPESAVGACDHLFLNMFLQHPELGTTEVVNGSRPLYNYRRSATTDTAGRGNWVGVKDAVRELLAAEWSPPQWGRFEP